DALPTALASLRLPDALPLARASMDRARDGLLADAVLAADDRGRLVVGDLRDGLEHGLHLRALREQSLEQVLLADLLAERAVFARSEEHTFELSHLGISYAVF